MSRVMVMADMSAIYLDYVYCNRCDTKMLVNLGEDVCPLCKSEGNMEDIAQEMDNPIFGGSVYYGRYINLPEGYNQKQRSD